MNNTEQYIDNEKFENEIQDFQRTGRVSDTLGQMLLELHEGVLRHRNFCRYRDDLKEEMRGYSLQRIISNGLNSWKQGRGKAFSYFSRAIFLNYITVLKKHYNKINKWREYIKNTLVEDLPTMERESVIRTFQDSSDLDVF